MPKCIFCPRTNLTHEHILSDFLHTILSGADFREESFDGMMEVDGTLKFVVIPPANHQGGVHTKAAYCVCEDCNTGWMSRIVDAASYWAKPIVRGRPIELNEIQQRQLASWIALSAISADWLGKGRFKISQDDRDYMFAHGVPPPHWSIFIGTWEGPLLSAASQNPLYMIHPEKGTAIFTMHTVASIQGCLFTLTHVASAGPPFAVPESIYDPYLVRLWPIERRWVIEDKTIHWPLVKNIPVTGQFYKGTVAYDLSRRLRDQLNARLQSLDRGNKRS